MVSPHFFVCTPHASPTIPRKKAEVKVQSAFFLGVNGNEEI
jgi:hypothetical protein